MKPLALLPLVLLLASCGGPPKDPAMGGACKATCDCPALAAPLGCPGEWMCNLSSVCQYTCKNVCNGSGVSTCPIDEECNMGASGFCSARKTCK